jgi:para-aminobenzoate synthetase component 1
MRSPRPTAVVSLTMAVPMSRESGSDPAATVPDVAALAHVAGRLATDLQEVSHDLEALRRPGFWVVVGDFEESWTLLRFGRVHRQPEPPSASWPGVAREAWTSSLDRIGYQRAVADIRERIARGDVYQVNLCRVLTAPLPGSDLLGLRHLLVRGNPAPYLWTVLAPQHGVELVSASPELFLQRHGDQLTSSPIKGTGVTRDDLQIKDVAENVMIVDLVRNDLSRVAEVGSVAVDGLLSVEQHPSLVHLVSTVSARLAADVGWPEILAATFPPGSVTGAPKTSALRTIRDLEPVPRGPYCGAIGWVDGSRGQLAVGIRTFWRSRGRLSFGTGAGITWGSDAGEEWQETELKAAHLLGLAARRT